ncbi:riboflavin synthase [Bacillus massilinigeriensis]|uniref:riboflavin synthase n=1 Tax=Bacillus mediterraneensis TaxID=1805474 RepID=UPI0008F967C1|nr:riboflavin synthase [Bacillus mediterraneensis]
MFTGIIEEVGKVKSIKKGNNAFKLWIQAHKIMEGTKHGDSIAVNGVCLTVTEMTSNSFCADVMPETLKATNIGSFQNGTPVNLERAIASSERFGGHFVSGHVDGTGTIIRSEKSGNAILFEIKVSSDLVNGMIEKGSIAVDGISLTIFRIQKGSFFVSIIPHTLQETVLGKRTRGDMVNIETDMIGKYIRRYLQASNPVKASAINESFLTENGFY